MGKKQYGIDPNRLKEYAKEIQEVLKTGVEIAIVIGGGNILEVLQALAMVRIEYKEIIWEC